MNTISIVVKRDDVEYVKWISSINYEDSCAVLLRLAEEQDEDDVIDYILPLVISLGAMLEARLNDWLIIDTFDKHGPDRYEPLVRAYISMSPKSKMRTAIAVMTDNHFQLKEEAPLVRDLDELIEARNKIVHPKPIFYTQVSKHSHRPRRQRPKDHPLSSLNAQDCRRYLEAIKSFDRLFFVQYDEGEIRENELIRALEKKIGH